MKHEIGTVLEWLPGGNKYEVVSKHYSEGSNTRGCYGLKCIDFWCSEEFTDQKTCTRLGQIIYETGFAVDMEMIVNTSSFYSIEG